MEKVRLEHDVGHFSLEQLAMCFLFYLLSVVIFLNASSTVFLQLLPVLMDLRICRSIVGAQLLLAPCIMA